LILLKKQNGVTIGVRPNRLSTVDLDFVRESSGGGPAGAVAADPLAGVETAEDTIRTIAAEVEKGNVAVMWYALPKSYQADVNGLVHAFAEKMDADVWNQGFAVASKTLNLLKTKKDFILSNPAVEQAPIDGNAVGDNWDAFVDVIAVLVNSEISDLDKMKTLDVGAFLNGPVKQFTEKTVAVAKTVSPDAKAAFGTAGEIKVSTVKDDGDTVTLKIEGAPSFLPVIGDLAGPPGVGEAVGGDAFGDDAPEVGAPGGGEPEEREMVRVEGRWVPKGLADQWPVLMAGAKEAINGISLAESKPQIMDLIAKIDGAGEQLKNAQTADDFNAAIGAAMGMFGPMVGSPEGGPPGGAPPEVGGGDDPFGAAPPGDAPF
jgi:hypothetical protein